MFTIVVLCMVALLGTYYWYRYGRDKPLTCIVSNRDGNTYCVRDRKQQQRAANLLAEVTGNMVSMVQYLHQHHPSDPRVQRLHERFDPQRVSETLPSSDLTAYSENKGEQLAFCLNTTKQGNKLIDLNTLTFVALHELSHIMSETVGHNTEFWTNFAFVLHNAKEAGIYTPVDYKQEPQAYCGMKITDNPYFDYT